MPKWLLEPCRALAQPVSVDTSGRDNAGDLTLKECGARAKSRRTPTQLAL